MTPAARWRLPPLPALPGLPRRGSRIFLVLSLTIAVLDGSFVLVNTALTRRTFHAEVAAEGESMLRAFRMSNEQVTASMRMVGTLLAGDGTIQQLMWEARDAIQAEGGGKGGPRAAAVREALLSKVGDAWNNVQRGFGTRQLHFHLGPEALSFLRVHAPHKYGDTLKGVRHTIVHAARTRTPVSGFESGRVYAGLRGVVPIWARDPGSGAREMVATLGVGISFDWLLETFHHYFGYNGAVLLQQAHVEETMWPDHVSKVMGPPVTGCECYVEASSDAMFLTLLKKLLATDRKPAPGRATTTVALQGRTYAVSFDPLYDFLRQQDPDRPHVGMVVLWTDVTAQAAAANRAIGVNVFYGVMAYVLLEALLYLAFRLAHGRLRAEISRKTAALEASNRDLSTFAYAVSHDLKEPLRMITGHLGLLKQRLGSSLSGSAAASLEHALGGARRLETMIVDLLDLSRVTTQGDRFAAVPLAGVVAEALANVQSLADETGGSLSVTAPLPVVRGDRAQLVRLFQNLFSNAFKYRAPERLPVITLAARRLDSGPYEGLWEISVADNGRGIPRARQEVVFEPFVRGETPRPEEDTPTEGHGVGLSLCRRIVEHHRGLISLTSTEGRGTTITFVLEPAGETEAS